MVVELTLRREFNQGSPDHHLSKHAAAAPNIPQPCDWARRLARAARSVLAGLAKLAPIPPLTLVNWQVWIFRLRDRGQEHIETTRIDPLFSQATKLALHSLRTSPPKLTHRRDSEQLKVFQHRRTN